MPRAFNREARVLGCKPSRAAAPSGPDNFQRAASRARSRLARSKSASSATVRMRFGGSARSGSPQVWYLPVGGGEATQVTRLPADFREVVVLRDYQGLSYQEIAEVAGCSVKAVKSRLFRARSVLRDKLRRYLKE